jgi:hypothetical protein
MKKSILLIVACVFAFATVQAQSSEVEATTQLTKAEQFKHKSNFIKEETIFNRTIGIKIYATLFTDLQNGEQLVALKFHGVTGPLGYLDMEHVDDLLLALETILKESNNSEKQENYSISFTAPGGIDVHFTTEGFPGLTSGQSIRFSKKWYYIDDYGVITSKYSEDVAILPNLKALPLIIDAIKEAKVIAQQAIAK